MPLALGLFRNNIWAAPTLNIFLTTDLSGTRPPHQLNLYQINPC
jgi:hypothetical protein